MKKAKRNEVPKEYRKDYKKKILHYGGLALTALLFDALLILIVFC